MKGISEKTMKALFKGFTLLWGLALIAVMTLTDIGFNKRFDFVEWLSNALILVGIMVFGLLMGESIGTDKQKERQDGLFQAALREYDEKYKAVEGEIVYFDQFYHWLMPKQLHDKKYAYLIQNGVDATKAEKIIKHCTIDDFQSLCEHIIEKETESGEKVRIRKLNEYEKAPVEAVLKGEIKLKASKPSYYLTAQGEADDSYLLEEGNEIKQIRKRNKFRKRALKITATLFVSFIWGAFTTKEFAQGGEAQTKAWVNLITRVTALFTSLFSGWTTATLDVKLLAHAIMNKSRVLTVFDESLKKRLFVVKSEKELEEEELKEYEESERKAKESVVNPEIEFQPNLLEAK